MSISPFSTFTEPPGVRPLTSRANRAARRFFACCRTRAAYVVHAWPPSMKFDPDYTVVECCGCGAVWTIGDVAAMHDEPGYGVVMFSKESKQ